MTTINLLPWRSKHVKVSNNLFYTIAGISACSCLLVIMVINFYAKSLVADEKKDIKYLQRQIRSLEGQIKEIKGLQQKKEELLAKREVIQKLQASRPFIVKIFDNIVRTVPKGVYLTEIKRLNNELTFQGVSESNSRVSLFMRNLSRLSWVTDAILSEIKTVEIKGKDITNTKIIFTLDINIKDGK